VKFATTKTWICLKICNNKNMDLFDDFCNKKSMDSIDDLQQQNTDL